VLNERQAKILSAVIKEYVSSAEPVPSKVIADGYDLDVSPATVRNDMAMLEELGLLRQPHTSAGRIPTEDGYRLYLKMLEHPQVSKRIHAPLRRAAAPALTAKDRVREVAKALVELSGETAIATLDKDWQYYTGFSELFRKPDFQDLESLRSISGIIDKMDDVLRGLYHQTDKDMSIWIGRDNPLSGEMATVMVRYELPNGLTGMVGLTGPLRMRYKRNMQLLSEAKRLLEM
jgi:heat-inducible transcriptional repressor